jgi:hypothetical protein
LEGNLLDELPKSIAKLSSSLEYLSLPDRMENKAIAKIKKWLPNTKIEFL